MDRSAQERGKIHRQYGVWNSEAALRIALRGGLRLGIDACRRSMTLTDRRQEVRWTAMSTNLKKWEMEKGNGKRRSFPFLLSLLSHAYTYKYT